jgi:hypothetical protein
LGGGGKGLSPTKPNLQTAVDTIAAVDEGKINHNYRGKHKDKVLVNSSVVID